MEKTGAMSSFSKGSVGLAILRIGGVLRSQRFPQKIGTIKKKKCCRSGEKEISNCMDKKDITSLGKEVLEARLYVLEVDFKLLGLCLQPHNLQVLASLVCVTTPAFRCHFPGSVLSP